MAELDGLNEKVRKWLWEGLQAQTRRIDCKMLAALSKVDQAESQASTLVSSRLENYVVNKAVLQRKSCKLSDISGKQVIVLLLQVS